MKGNRIFAPEIKLLASISDLKNQLTTDFIMQHIPSGLSDMLYGYNVGSLSVSQKADCTD
ncbi:MAG: hypothetical protein ACI3ZB_08285 [Prevotella sp.]